LGAESADEAGIGDFLVIGDFVFGDEVNCVGTFDSVADALGAATKFIGGGVEPVFFGGWIGYEGSVFHAFSGDGIDDCIGKRVGRKVIWLLKKCGEGGFWGGLGGGVTSFVGFECCWFWFLYLCSGGFHPWSGGTEDVGELFECIHFVVAEWEEWEEWGVGVWMAECVDEILCGMLGSVRRGQGRQHGFGGEKLYGVGDACCVCFCDVDLVATIVFEGRCNVPSGCAVRCPGGTVGWFGMGDDFGAGWCHGCFVVIKISVELAIGK
jgi:hypothetical protein